MTRSNTLLEPRRIAIIGGGPAGAFSGLLLKRLALQAGRELEVLIFERKEFGVTGPRSCNMCAGIVSNSLIQKLEDLGVEVLGSVVQREIEAYTLEVRGAAVRLEKPPGARIYTAFRSGGPMGERFGTERSFDHFVLQAAISAGAQHIPQVVRSVRPPSNPQAPVVLEDATGDEHQADAVIGAFGVNSRMVRSFEELGFGYRAPRTATAAQCEIPLSSEEIETLFGNEVKALSLGIPGVSLAAMIPKERHVTVSLIGRDVGQRHLERFLQLPEVRAHFPPGWQVPDNYCHCRPRLPITAAQNVVADRVLVVGDAHVSRYLKNGLDSAFITASLAAEAIIAGGVGRENLVRRYVQPCRRVFTWDNLCGRALLAVHHLLGREPRIAAAHLRFAALEQQRSGPKPLNAILWGMLTGDEPYSVVLRRALSPSLQLRLAWAAMKALCQPGIASQEHGTVSADSREDNDDY